MLSEFKELLSVWGPNPHCERGYGFQINANEDGTKLVYGSEKNLVVRDYFEPSRCSVYSDHRGEVSVAKFNHKGDSIASADILGNVHILKLKGDELAVEKEMIGIGGKIYDLCWYPNDKGLACGGDSKGINGRVFTLSGTDQGQVTAPKRITSIDMTHGAFSTNLKDTMLVTGCDDNRARTYAYRGGFKAVEKDMSHENSCNMARFAPDSDVVVSVGGKGLKINKAGEDASYALLHHIKAAHKGTIYAVSWSTNGHYATSSADKSVKVWDIASPTTAVVTFDMKKQSGYKRDVVDFQVGCCYAGENLVSLSLSGDINYLDPRSGKIERIIRGPAGSFASIDVSSDGSFAGISTAGEILLYSPDGVANRSAGLDEPKKGVGCVKFGADVYSTSFDDKVIEAKEGKLTHNQFGLTQQPVYMRRAGEGSEDLFVVVTASAVHIMSPTNMRKPVASIDMPANLVATCAAVNQAHTELAIATSDKRVLFYDLAMSGGRVSPKSGKVFGPFPHAVTSMTFCPSTGKLAAGLQTKYVRVMTADGADFCGDLWCRHSSTVFDVDFSPDGSKLLSCGGEGTVCVWNANDGESFSPLKQFKLAHKSGVIQARWIDNDIFFTAGRYDGTVKKWSLA